MTSTFELVVRGSSGVRTLVADAADAAAARLQATGRGYEVLACRPRAGAGSRARAGAALPARKMDVASLAYELASLMGAGLSMMDCLRTLARKERLPARRAVLLDIVKGIDEGLPLSAALGRHAHRFPPLLVATVAASEQTGELGAALGRYAQHQQTVKALRDKVVGAAIYPMLLLGVGFVVVLFLLGVVVPKFATLIESSRRELPWTSQLMMAWGRLVAANLGTVLAGAAAAAIALALGLRRLVRTGAKARWVEAMPFVGRPIRQFRHAQLYRTTGMLVHGGIPAPRALGLAAGLLGDADRQRLHQAITFLQEGRSISGALTDAQLADPVAASLLAVAERTGQLSEILGRIAAFHESGLQRSVELSSRLVEPVLMIGIGLVVGAIIVMMYLPIFDLASSLQ
ncbi:MAG: type II secretion system F family protein [Burkholderiaceae bacterium]